MNLVIMGLTATLLLLTPLVADDKHIGTIDFYGYSGLDLKQLRAALPFHEGDALASKAQFEAAKVPYARMIGRSRVEFAPICCLEDGRYSLFVGIEEPDAPKIPINPRPLSDARLPSESFSSIMTSTGKTAKGSARAKAAKTTLRVIRFPPTRRRGHWS